MSCIWFCFRVPFSYNPFNRNGYIGLLEEDDQSFEEEARRRGFARRVQYLSRLDPRPNSILVTYKKTVVSVREWKPVSIYTEICIIWELLKFCTLKFSSYYFKHQLISTVCSSKNYFPHCYTPPPPQKKKKRKKKKAFNLQPEQKIVQAHQFFFSFITTVSWTCFL